MAGNSREQKQMQAAIAAIAAILVVVVTADGDSRQKAASIRAEGAIGKPVSIETRRMVDEMAKWPLTCLLAEDKFWALVLEQVEEGGIVNKPIIFVLDDDAEQAELLAQALSSASWKIRVWSDPIRCLASLTSDGADLLVADLSMPWLDGGDVVASARFRRPDLKVVLISGYPRGATIAARHHVAFFAKPIDLDAFRATVHSLLEGDQRPHP